MKHDLPGVCVRPPRLMGPYPKNQNVKWDISSSRGRRSCEKAASRGISGCAQSELALVAAKQNIYTQFNETNSKHRPGYYSWRKNRSFTINKQLTRIFNLQGTHITHTSEERQRATVSKFVRVKETRLAHVSAGKTAVQNIPVDVSTHLL